MQNYKLSVSKNGKKYTIVFKAETEKIARERVHKEGYSILSIEENNENNDLGNIFIFSVYTKEGLLKNGKIVGDDIFKTYIKLRKNLEYDVKSLYFEKDKDLNEEQKEKIIRNLNDEYLLLFKGKKKENIDKLRDKINKEKEQNNKNKNFYLKKELEETYKLIEFVLKKLEKLLSGKTHIILELGQKEKLKTVYNAIIKLKQSTNISKLKQIGELALIKIGQIELAQVESTHEENSKILLKETNLLLKKIGSKETFIEKNKDISYILNNALKSFFIYIKGFKKRKEKIDKYSHSFIKNRLFLIRYKEKLKEHNKYLLKNVLIFIFDKEKRLDGIIKRRVLKQNISLFQTKEKGVRYSYTTVKKGFTKIVNYILLFIKNIKNYLFIVIFIYTLLFIISLNINYYFNIIELNFQGIFYFIVLFFIYLIFYITRNLFLIFLNFVILFFIVIFGVVNF